MSPRRVFDRFMVAVDAARNPKVRRLKRTGGRDARWAWFHGVLPIAASAPMRGSFCVADLAADEHDVADVADVTVTEAAKMLKAARLLGMLEADEHGVEWVHDFEEYNPEPKQDRTAAKRARDYRERQRQNRDAERDVTLASRRDVTPRHGSVTPPEVEGEEKNTPLTPRRGEWQSPPAKPAGGRQRDRLAYDTEVVEYAAWLLPDVGEPHRSQLVVMALGGGVEEPVTNEGVAAYVRRWYHGNEEGTAA